MVNDLARRTRAVPLPYMRQAPKFETNVFCRPAGSARLFQRGQPAGRPSHMGEPQPRSLSQPVQILPVGYVSRNIAHPCRPERRLIHHLSPKTAINSGPSEYCFARPGRDGRRQKRNTSICRGALYIGPAPRYPSAKPKPLPCFDHIAVHPRLAPDV